MRATGAPPGGGGSGGGPYPRRRSTSLAGDAGSAGTARRFVADALGAWELTGGDDASLLASELVTNAFRHAGGPLTLTLTLTDGCLRIAVVDRDVDGTPVRQVLDPEATGGRGLALVEAVADGWGVTRRRQRGTKSVWCELSVGPGRS